MRDNLRVLLGQWILISATFDHIGEHMNGHGQHESHMLLKDIKVSLTGRKLCDHNYVPLSSNQLDLSALRLADGDIVEMEAQVEMYCKSGSATASLGCHGQSQVDYTFAKPRKLRHLRQGRH